jgi:serine/threonine protein kinase
MWSLGCIVVELFLGLPLFPGSSEYNQICRIVEMLGIPPTWMLEMGKQSGEFFEKTQDEFGRKTYRLKSLEQYSREHNTKEQPSKKYFSASTLEEIIRSYPMPRKNMKQAEIDRGRLSFFLCSRWDLANYRRTEQSRRFHRLRAGTPVDQSSRAMVTPTSQAAPVHHPAEVHGAVHATNEP